VVVLRTSAKNGTVNFVLFWWGRFLTRWMDKLRVFRLHGMRYFGTRMSLCQKALLPGRGMLAVPCILIVTIEVKH
jgi:hypothetical protein